MRKHITIQAKKYLNIRVILVSILALCLYSSFSFAQCPGAAPCSIPNVPPSDTPGAGGGTTAPIGTSLSSGGSCVKREHERTQRLIRLLHDDSLRPHITEEFQKHQKWITFDFFFGYVRPTMMYMTEHLTMVAMHQLMIIGVLFDAKMELETQRLYQLKTAEAHRDYQPSMDMCIISSTTRDLAATAKHGDFVNFTLAQRSQERQLGVGGSASADGPASDLAARLQQYKTRYCQVMDNANGLSEVCGAGPPTKEFINRDIDYTNFIDLNRTLNIDFTDSSFTDDEQDVLAMSNNLFAHNIYNRLQFDAVDSDSADDEYLDQRSVIAKRSVAENSFYAIVGMKASGNGAAATTAQYLPNLLKQLGVSDVESQIIMGENPSYYAQMEAIAQRVYQTPQFYAGLHDTEANVNRKEVAMQAIGLMLNRDIYKSELRSEALLALLVEMEAIRMRDDVQGRLNSLEENDKEGN